jgi:hypothetical protein
MTRPGRFSIAVCSALLATAPAVDLAEETNTSAWGAGVCAQRVAKKLGIPPPT